MTWRERIVAARARGRFDADDLMASRNWDTCAVGEQRAAMPDIIIYRAVYPSWSTAYRAPIDPLLKDLGDGDHFVDAIYRNDVDEAERLLDAIEDRALVLKREARA